MAASASLAALVLAVVVAALRPVNPGLVALALAFPIGIYLAGMKPSAIAGGFPASLFLILVGVTCLFALARQNGTLALLTRAAVRVVGGRVGLLPITFFLLAVVIASLGPGNIAAVALLAPIAFAIAGRVGIGAFLMTVMIANGANAGAFSPIAPTGIIANGLIAQIGLPPMPDRVYLNSLIAQSAVAIGGYFAFGGPKLWRRAGQIVSLDEVLGPPEPITWQQWLTIGGLVGFIGAVSIGKVDIGAAALITAVLLALAQPEHAESSLSKVPWDVILMLSGMTTLIQLVEKTGGLALFTDLLCRIANADSIVPLLALVAGIVSTYSNSSGVVMPVFLALVPELTQRIGGDAVAMVSAVNVGAHLVDVSPLSTLGALCIASAAASEDRRRLFNRLLAWGMSMAVIGAAICWLFFDVLL